MFFNTNYQRSSAAALVNYIEKDCPLRNSAGRKLTDRERQGFIEKSQRHNFEREIRISPDPAVNVSQRDLERETQRFLRDFSKGRTSVRSVYAYHEDNGIPHVHVAMTGEERDLYLDRDDVERSRDRLGQRLERERDRERERERTLEQERELEQQIERARDRDRKQERERGYDRGFSL